MKNFVDALQQLTNPDMIFKVADGNWKRMETPPQTSLTFLVFGFGFSTQDWWDGVKNTMEKPVFDKKRMGDMFEEMFASLGDGDTAGHGTFRKKFIKVWGGICL